MDDDDMYNRYELTLQEIINKFIASHTDKKEAYDLLEDRLGGMSEEDFEMYYQSTEGQLHPIPLPAYVMPQPPIVISAAEVYGLPAATARPVRAARTPRANAKVAPAIAKPTRAPRAPRAPRANAKRVPEIAKPARAPRAIAKRAPAIHKPARAPRAPRANANRAPANARPARAARAARAASPEPTEYGAFAHIPIQIIEHLFSIMGSQGRACMRKTNKSFRQYIDDTYNFYKGYELQWVGPRLFQIWQEDRHEISTRSAYYWKENNELKVEVYNNKPKILRPIGPATDYIWNDVRSIIGARGFIVKNFTLVCHEHIRYLRRGDFPATIYPNTRGFVEMVRSLPNGIIKAEKFRCQGFPTTDIGIFLAKFHPAFLKDINIKYRQRTEPEGHPPNWHEVINLPQWRNAKTCHVKADDQMDCFQSLDGFLHFDTVLVDCNVSAEALHNAEQVFLQSPNFKKASIINKTTPHYRDIPMGTGGLLYYTERIVPFPNDDESEMKIEELRRRPNEVPGKVFFERIPRGSANPTNDTDE